MRFLVPAYYNAFTCKAESCTDNCCIGWEISIDKDTANFYAGLDGDFGKRLKESITLNEEPSFILQKERCPFLNKKGLCDIIINLGEGALCQICRDHPRFFEWYGFVKEGGIGLSCEEGARLILSCGDYIHLSESHTDEWIDEDFDNELYQNLFLTRENLFNKLADKSTSFINKASDILAAYGESREFSFNDEIKKAVLFLQKTEPVNNLWEEKLALLKSTYLNESSPELMPTTEDEAFLCNLASYFLWRYFIKSAFDGDEKSKIKLSLFSVTVIFALVSLEKETDKSSWIKSAVLFSKQMEYSDENIELFYDTY